MKKIVTLLLLGITTMLFAQIPYGSNNGKYLKINDINIYYEEYGQGEPLLFLHGGMGSVEDLKQVIPLLAKRFHVIVPDQPGHGRSDFPDSLSYQLMADYELKLLTQLKLDSVNVLGWSDGGNTALLMAKKNPKLVKKIVVSGANYSTEAFDSGMLDEEKNFKDTIWVKNNMKDWIEKYQRLNPKSDWKCYMQEISKMWFEKVYFPKSDLEAITVPTMIVLGDRDMISLEQGIEMYRAIPKSQFCVLPNTSHMVFWEKPEWISQIATDFFETKSP